MVNLTALNNMSNPEFNTTIINNSEAIMKSTMDNANTATEGYFGLIVLTLICLFMFYIMFREDGFFRYDMLKSGLISTGISIILGIVMILSDIISSWQHVMWFGIIYIFFIIATFIQKRI